LRFANAVDLIALNFTCLEVCKQLEERKDFSFLLKNWETECLVQRIGPNGHQRFKGTVGIAQIELVLLLLSCA
jgi:hypothetical protein